MTSTTALQAGITLAIPSVKDVRVGASGPGEIAGPAVAVTVRVRNGTSRAFDLAAIAVNAVYGGDTPASPTSSGGAKPLLGSLAAGQTTDGLYVFLVPTAQASTLRVEVSSSTSPDIVVFQR